jgi:exonuclease SbcD
MRILHTSDWHLGSSLEGVSRDADHATFLEWLAQTLEREAVDVLVVAGDVFDQAQPSSEAQRLYYRFLTRIRGGPLRKVVIVGGNHDSAARLDAPREVLEALDVHVVGGLHDEASWERCLCPIPDRTGGTGAVVLAVPFLHEYRLGLRTALVSDADLRRSFHDSFQRFYRDRVDQARARFDGAPVIATGHLTCVGYEPGDFPVDVHRVGTIGGLSADLFDPRLQYVALGHIHRSYRVGQSRAYYSGSPVALCLKEAVTPRRVRIVDLADAPDEAATVRSLDVPSTRPILELKGTLKSVEAQLAALEWETALPPIVYARVEVDRFSAATEESLRERVRTRGERAPLLVQVRQERRQEEGAPAVLPTRALRELSPEEVFVRLCQTRNEPLDDGLLDTFRALLSPDAEEGAA